MTNHRLAIIFLSFLYINPVIADQCPTAEVVKNREISREYEWTIEERKKLEDVLAVDKLYSVRIKNQGEFIACYYTGNNGLMRLDAKPLGNGCRVEPESGKWEVIDKIESVCKEDDLAMCQYVSHCEPESS